MSSGHTSFHHPLLMHGSFASTSNSQRRATVLNVFGDGVISNLDFTDQNSPGTNNYPEVPLGEKMCGRYYPLLLNPEIIFNNYLSEIPTVER